jgi:hypothetical protein
MRTLLLLLLAAVVLAAQPQTLYRWKDRTGKEHVTQTPPPPDATSLDVRQPQGGPTSKPLEAQTEDPSRKQKQSSPPAGPNPGLLERWKALDQRLEEARTKQDTTTIEAVVEGLFRESLWGSGLWAIPLLPIATLALVVLLGWWVGSGLKQPFSAGVMVLSVLVGLALGQLALSRFLYRIQLSRLQSNLSMLENNLGGKLPRGSHRAALQQHLTALETAARPVAPPWAFLLECRSAEDTMVKVALDP